jgi:hypothetical protein
MEHENEYVRAWAIQLLWEDRSAPKIALEKLAILAAEDSSSFVRLYIASALQRTQVEDRFPVLKALTARDEDKDDHNLPLMYWYAMEPVVGADQGQGLALLKSTGIPILRQYIARRMTTGALASTN